MKKLARIVLPVFVVGALILGLTALVGTPDAQAKGKPKPGNGCPRVGIACADVWDPVICDDGQVYSNACYAWVACATGCVPYGDGGPGPVEY
jgi:hypothetical protein